MGAYIAGMFSCDRTEARRIQKDYFFRYGTTLRGLMSAKNSPIAWDLRCEIREKMISWLQQKHAYALPRRRGEIHIEDSDIEFTPSAAPRESDDTGMSDKIDHPDDAR